MDDFDDDMNFSEFCQKMFILTKYPPSRSRMELIQIELRELIDRYRLALFSLRNIEDEEKKSLALLTTIDMCGWLAELGQYGYLDAFNEFIVPELTWPVVEKALRDHIKQMESRMDTLLKTRDEDKVRKIMLLQFEVRHYIAYLYHSDTYDMSNLCEAIVPTMQAMARWLAIQDGDDPDEDEEL